MRNRNPPRLQAFDYLGFHRYFLTYCTRNRHPLFADTVAVELVLSQILRAAADRRFSVVAYCFMPDHLHLLIAAESENSDCRSFISLSKQYSGFEYARQLGKPLWQRYSYERTLRDHEETASFARYILENPVRAGLVKSPGDYPFMGSTICEMRELVDWCGAIMSR